jgi:hypothetical protein
MRIFLRKHAMAAALAAAAISISSGAATMQQNSDEAVSMLRLPDGDYYRLDRARLSAVQKQMIMMGRYEGTAIGLPAVADTAREKKLPLLWATQVSNLRNWRVVGARNSTLVVADLLTGKVTVQDAYFGPKKQDLRDVPMSLEGDPADVLAPRGTTADTEVLDVRGIANLPWQPGRYAVTVLMHDWKSNTATVKLLHSGAEVGDAAQRALRWPHSEAAGLEKKPPAPPEWQAKADQLAGPGMVLEFAPPGGAGSPRSLLRGAVKVALAPGNLVADSKGPVQAVLRITVLVAAIDQAKPRKAELLVPVLGRAALKAGDVVPVAFEAQLEAALRETLPPATYQVYAVANEVVAGPLALTIAGSARPASPPPPAPPALP